MRNIEDDLGLEVVQALWADKVTRSDRSDHFEIDYSGDCKAPFGVARSDRKYRTVRMLVRCRKCGPCRRAKRNYWGYAAMKVTLDALETGNRTWFGTLTLSTDAQVEFLRRARMRHAEPNAEWWSDPHCDERFAAVRVEFLRECQKYWKRLRKSGAAFKYLLVFERHKSGLPHAHFLLHEQDGPILKRRLRSQWPWGFFQASLVGGRARNAAAPEKASWYAVKYLTKSNQARVVASRGYAPEKRPKGQSWDGGAASPQREPNNRRQEETRR